MRLLILLSGLFVLANAIVFLLPTDAETTNLKYESSPEMNESEIRFLARESLSDDTLSIDIDIGIQPEAKKTVKTQAENNIIASSPSDISELEMIKPEKPELEVSGLDEAKKDGFIAALPDVDPSNAAATLKVVLPENVDVPAVKETEEDVVPVKVIPVIPSIVQCYRIGPFLREARMRASGNQLVDIKYKVIEREATEVFATRVYVGPFNGLALALQARKDLTAVGVNDHFHRRDPSGDYIVSLGIYSKNASAIRQRSRFQSIDVSAKTRDEKTRLPKNYWLELPGDITQDDIASLSTISWGESSVSLGRHPCQA